MHVSVIGTVLNEAATIDNLLKTLAQQTRPPDEILFVDGGSTDETVRLMTQLADQYQLPLRVIVAPGANISRGRNLAIEAARGPIIASTDAGVRLDERWLERLLEPFEAEKLPPLVGGFFVPDPQTPFEVAMGATVLPTVADINPQTFLPSSRSVAFLKSSWLAAGKYPEWLDFCEDLIFDIRLREATGPFTFVPDAVAYFRPRGSLRAFFKQYYQYARGDGKSDLWRKRHAIRYATYLVAGPALLILGWKDSVRWWGLGVLLAMGGMFLTPYRRLPLLWSGLSTTEKLQAMLWIPIIRLTGDVAKMIGYPVGWQWRLARLDTQPALRWR